MLLVFRNVHVEKPETINWLVEKSVSIFFLDWNFIVETIADRNYSSIAKQVRSVLKKLILLHRKSTIKKRLCESCEFCL